MDILEKSKFDSLKEEYSEQYIELLKAISEQKQISYEDMIDKLPSSELVKRDEKFVRTYPIARVLMGIADPASYVLTAFYLTRGIPSDYPEQPIYYISPSEGNVKAPFTKSEFIESIKEPKGKLLEKK